MELTKEQASRLVYTFGPFQLEPAEHRLVRDGRDVRLPLKVFETLVVLVERHGLLVEKDDLMKALWPGMFVEEATLAGNISLLRKALGDAPGPEESQYIETVTKRGYRFIAKVMEINPTAESSLGAEDAGVASVVAAPSGPQQNGLVGGAFLEHFKALRSGVVRERVAWATAAIAVIGALLTIGFGFTRVRRSGPEAATMRSAILPPPGHQFRISLADLGAVIASTSAPAISPNGSLLVSPVRDSQGSMVLWVRSLNTGEGKILQGTEDGADPFWSPDSRSIGFFADGKLKRIDSDGSSLQTLCDAVGGRGGAWSSNGTILFAPTSFAPLYAISAGGGEARQITKLNTGAGTTSHRWPVFLPDGRHFLYLMKGVSHPETVGIYAGSLDSQDDHMVVRTAQGPAFETDGTIVYIRDGEVVAQPFDEQKMVTTGEPTVLPDRVAFVARSSRALFSTSRTGMLVYYPAAPGGAAALRWYDRDGGRGETLDTGYAVNPTLSPDNTHAIVTVNSTDGLSADLWNYDLVRGTKTRLTTGLGYKQSPVWQQDGGSLIFGSGLVGGARIARIKSDGTGAMETIHDIPGVSENPTSICRDGRYLMYLRTKPGSQPGAWILPLTGNQKPFALVQSQFTTTYARFSPDCKWVAYASNETGQFEVYLTHFPDAARKYRVSTQGGMSPQWRGDGRELFYFSVGQNSMMAVNVEEKGEGISLGAPRALFHPASDAAIFGFAVTADGRRFLISEPNSLQSTVPLMLVTNWLAELKR